MIRILFFSFRKPYPLESGDSLRTYNICKKLIERGNKIFLVYFRHGDQNSLDERALSEIAEDIFVMDCPSFYNQLYGKLYKIFVSLFPFPNILFRPKNIKNLQKNIKKIIERDNIDIIHVRDFITGVSLINFREIPKLLDLTDSFSLASKREMAQQKSIKKKMRSYLSYNWHRGIEKFLLRDSDVVTVVSPADKEMLESLYSKANVEIIPNGVDFNYFSPKKDYKEEYPSILFHGVMSFPPNIHAVKYIYKEIFPIIKSELPETKFFIVGKNPVDEIKRMSNGKDVIVTGYVDDVREYICKASITLYPMKTGSGIKNKILEAMAMEKPVVTTQMGGEALTDEVKKCLLIGETAEEIANHVISLLRDREKRIELGKKGREIVMKEYSWDKVAEKYEKLYTELL